MIDNIFLWIGSSFTVEANLFYTKAQGMLWSLADFIIIYTFLKIVDLYKARQKYKPIVYRYLLLWLSAALVPTLWFMKTAKDFYLLECLIFIGIQLPILVFTIFVEGKKIVFMMKDIVDNSGHNSTKTI